MLRIITILLIALALSGCATQADRQLSQLKAEITKSHEQGKISDAEYLRMLVKAYNTRQAIEAEQQRRSANALLLFGAMQQNQQPVYQVVQPRPLNGTSCITQKIGNTAYTDCN